MSQELPVSEWNNFTPEQKHLLQLWIKSLEEAQAASIELIKSFNDTETTSEATTTLNTVSFTENSDSIFLERSDVASPPELPDQVILSICTANCLLAPNRQECVDKCFEKHGLRLK